jgi:rhodanese-related sulfurtransferase
MRKVSLALIVLLIFPIHILAQGVEEILPEKAYEMLKNPKTFLVDVRSIAEYVFIGHPKMAYNIPLMFWSEEEQELVPNDHFIQDLKSRFKEEEVLIFMCRSGGRSSRAAKRATQEGFINVYNLKEGFEGEKDSQGYRTINGWKNRGLPYTYDLKNELIYQFPSQKLAKTELKQILIEAISQ